MSETKIRKRVQDVRESDTPTVPSDSNAWLMSYADMMTLISCFFILVVAFSNQEDPSFRKKADEFAKYFRGDLVEAKEKKIKRDEGENKRISEEKQIYKDDRDITQSEKSPTTLSSLNKIASISEITKPKSLEVTFSGSIMFKQGTTEITKEVELAIQSFINLLKLRKSPFFILFEGHTDDTDVKTNIYPSNWELSSARAAKVLKMFLDAGFSEKYMTIVGYGDTRPEYKNRDKKGQALIENQKLNRRVEIKVIASDEVSNEDLGLGIFFRELKKKQK